jgi:hippurate hydrolase
MRWCLAHRSRLPRRQRSNVIPQAAEPKGTVRFLLPEVRDLLERRVCEMAQGSATALRRRARVDDRRSYLLTANHPRETEFAVMVAGEIAGAATDLAWIMHQV